MTRSPAYDIPPVRALLLSLWSHLSRKRRRQVIALVGVMIISGFAELISLGAVIPFLAVLTNPGSAFDLPIVSAIASYFGLTSSSQIIIPFTILFAFTAVVVSLVRSVNLWLNGRLVAAVATDLSCESYKRTLFQPYKVHLLRNSGNVITKTTTQVTYTLQALSAMLNMGTSAIVAASLTVGLLLINFKVAISASLLFSSLYLIIARRIRPILRKNSKRISSANASQLIALQEGLGAIRDVLLDGSQPFYLNIYTKADKPLRRLQAQNLFLTNVPKYLLEAFGLVIISLLGGVLVIYNGSQSSVIPLLGAMALGAQRLLPSLQQIFRGWSSLKSNQAAIAAVVELLEQPLPSIFEVNKVQKLNKFICCKNVSFKYNENQKFVLENLNLEIHAGQKIGLIGSTGSGKSTLADLLMGLLEPYMGCILVDDIDINDSLTPDISQVWRNSIAHVPQAIYLADCTIAENIAFGISRENIEMSRVKLAAQKAQLSSFIDSLPDGYNTFVGERGVLLSGGQRQRLGLARALYKNSSFLVLDEATSALDNTTEEEVMKSIDSLGRDLTVLIVAHRISTLKNCDRVIKIENGKICADGPPSLILN
ncbi:ABC-type multidrug transport system, ATPase and permease components [Synechococcus sp. RCC307]|nr:ABC-type multidrug transport system, ATPase and permease components [Synechococcus sp. RCC307]